VAAQLAASQEGLSFMSDDDDDDCLRMPTGKKIHNK
jgi:hypothetical protein